MKPAGPDDPEVLLRVLLLGYLYGITSERKLVEELTMHLELALVHRPGFDGNSQSFDLLQEPARALPGVESV